MSKYTQNNCHSVLAKVKEKANEKIKFFIDCWITTDVNSYFYFVNQIVLDLSILFLNLICIAY